MQANLRLARSPPQLPWHAFTPTASPAGLCQSVNQQQRFEVTAGIFCGIIHQAGQAVKQFAVKSCYGHGIVNWATGVPVENCHKIISWAQKDVRVMVRSQWLLVRAQQTQLSVVLLCSSLPIKGACPASRSHQTYFTLEIPDDPSLFAIEDDLTRLQRLGW